MQMPYETNARFNGSESVFVLKDVAEYGSRYVWQVFHGNAHDATGFKVREFPTRRAAIEFMAKEFPNMPRFIVNLARIYGAAKIAPAK